MNKISALWMHSGINVREGILLGGRKNFALENNNLP